MCVCVCVCARDRGGWKIGGALEPHTPRTWRGHEGRLQALWNYACTCLVASGLRCLWAAGWWRLRWSWSSSSYPSRWRASGGSAGRKRGVDLCSSSAVVERAAAIAASLSAQHTHSTMAKTLHRVIRNESLRRGTNVCGHCESPGLIWMKCALPLPPSCWCICEHVERTHLRPKGGIVADRGKESRPSLAGAFTAPFFFQSGKVLVQRIESLL